MKGKMAGTYAKLCGGFKYIGNVAGKRKGRGPWS
jgi:hypothetical protein